MVSDDGVGMRDDVVVKDPPTLGLQLVDALVEQLDGELQFDTSKGTKFTIAFTIARSE